MSNKKLILIALIVLTCFLASGVSQMAKGQSKFFGNVMRNYIPTDYETYWNQITPEWMGKWAHVEPTRNSYNWTFLDSIYTYAKQKGFVFKEHTFVWRVEDPSWLSGLSSADRILEINDWMKTFCTRYPAVDLIDVVNEPLHETSIYAQDLGGAGATGWDWVIKAFEMAKANCPNSKLLINDYNIVAFEESTTKYLEIIKLLQARDLIHGIGIQCHQLEGAGPIPILKNLYRLADTGLPLYVSELDLFAADDTEQMNLYKKIFPLLWEHPAVQGVTLWGYVTNEMSSTAGLLNGTTERAALNWLRTQYFNTAVNKGPRAYFNATVTSLTANFNSARSWDVDGGITSFTWNFGDGKTGTGASPSNTYAAAGTYTVTLTVSDAQGLTNTFSDSVVVGSSGSTTDWSKPIAYGKEKFIGCTILHDYLSPNWGRYWNQVTPEYLGKWTSTEPNMDQMSWAGLDFAWNYAKTQGILFKGHTFMWGQQIPYWIGGLSATQQAAQVEEWIKLYCQRYSGPQLIDVVNEPLHETPNYVNAIGGTGSSGWDWVIWGYKKARQYCPNAKLLINDYYILTDTANTAKYIGIINLLKAQNLIDGIGCQAHHLETTSNSVILQNLNSLQATGLPVYISELDLDFADDTQQLNRFKTLFPLLYEHPAVKGVTFWGYTRGQQWLGGAWMYDPNASGSSGSSNCTSTALRSNIPLSFTWQDYSVTLTKAGKIRAKFANDGSGNSETMEVDYAIIDGVKYEAENQQVNTGVWNGLACGGSYSQMLHCPGYIEFPSGSSSVIIRARAVDKGGEQLTIEQVDSCASSNGTSAALPQERASLRWLKYEYGPTIASATKPTAAFKYNSTGLTFSFDATASMDPDGNIVSYSWTFGDTANGGGPKIDHTYTKAGSYLVQLTIFDNNGNGAVTSQTVTISSPPTANFTFTVTGTTVSVDGTSSSDPDGTITKYAWTYGDGSSGLNQVKDSHSYAGPGVYNVTLIVTDNSSATANVSASVTITATNVPPVADFVSSVNSLTVSFDASKSNDTDGTISKYDWNFGDGTTGTAKTVSHVYSKAGPYNVILTVTDNAGATNSKTLQVTALAPNALPNATFTWNATLLVASFNATKSTDSDGTIASYAWTFGDGTTGTGSTVDHSYSSTGSYTVTLKVTDNLGGVGSYSSVVSVAAANVPPTADFSASTNQLSVSLNANLSKDTDGYIVAYSWNLGNGATSASSSLVYTYAASGNYTITLKVTDNNGASASASKNVTVQGPNASPVANFTFTTNALAVSLNASLSTDPDGTIASYKWDLGDGTTSNGKTLSYTYATAGNYTVILTVKDNVGASNSIAKNVTVKLTNSPPVCGFSCSVWYLQASCNSNSTDDGQIIGNAWNWNDSTTSSGSASVSHNFTTGGNYNVTLTVTDNQGVSVSCVKTITATNPSAGNNPPVSVFGFWSQAKIIHYYFTGYDVDGQVTSYLWNFGDGTTGTQSAPVHTYAKTGVYNVTLTVKDDKGVTGVSSQSVNVTSPPTNIHVEAVKKGIVGTGTLYPQANVTVYDNNGSPVQNVVVSGQFQVPSLNIWQSVSATTNVNGKAIFTGTSGSTALTTFTFCVYGLQHPTLWFNSALNKVTSCS